MANIAPTVSRLEGNTYLVIGSDAPGSEHVRDQQLEGHLDYVERNCDRYLLAGPMFADDGVTLNGSFFLVSANSANEARSIVAGDPYVKAGTYAEISVQQVTAAAGKLIGGVIWESAAAIRAASRA